MGGMCKQTNINSQGFCAGLQSGLSALTLQGGFTQDQRVQSSMYVYRLRKDVRRICSR